MQFPTTWTARRGLVMASTAALALAACEQIPLDLDLRNRGDGFTTAAAAQTPPNRPRPDDRGIISYPNYQVAVARRNDTVRAMAGRLGLDADELARFNGIEPDTTLRRDEVIALPSRVAEPSPATGAAVTGPIQPTPAVNVQTLASAAIDRAGPTPVPAAATPAAPAPAPADAPQSGIEPIRHRVARGETTYSLARLYNVPARSIAEWNGLGPDLAIREGQYLLIPATGAAPPPAVVEPVPAPPGAGSVTPVPPSAAAPLPAETPAPASAPPPPAPPAPDLGAASPAPASTAQFVRPVEGPIIRAYSRGRNDGIDIGAAAGTAVRAAGAGEVAAITTNTDGIRIVVIKHDDNLLTVYTHLDNLTVERGARVTRGQTIGQVRAGDPSFLHFEVRVGMDSRDPADYLP